jgi:hypothetical protein
VVVKYGPLTASDNSSRPVSDNLEANGLRASPTDWQQLVGSIPTFRMVDDGHEQQPDHDLRPKADGSHVVEFRTAEGEVLAISIPRTEADVIRHFQERMPYSLFVLDVPTSL